MSLRHDILYYDLRRRGSLCLTAMLHGWLASRQEQHGRRGWGAGNCSCPGVQEAQEAGELDVLPSHTSRPHLLSTFGDGPDQSHNIFPQVPKRLMCITLHKMHLFHLSELSKFLTVPLLRSPSPKSLLRLRPNSAVSSHNN